MSLCVVIDMLTQTAAVRVSIDMLTQTAAVHVLSLIC